MKKIIYLSVIASAIFASCSQEPTSLQKTRVHPAFYSSSAMRYEPAQAVRVILLDSNYREGDLVQIMGLYYIVGDK